MKRVDLFFMALLVGVGIGFVCGTFTAINLMKRKAIEANVAEYIVDKTTGEVTFQYITPCKTP